MGWFDKPLKVKMKQDQILAKGEDRTKVTLSVSHMGNDIVVCIYNNMAHVGAVAVGDYDIESGRTATSIITRRGHKDDHVASRVAYQLTKATKLPSCVIVGIHIPAITDDEIKIVLNNVDEIIYDLLKGDYLNE